MRDTGEHPFVPLAIASVLIGVLDHSAWLVAYTGMLFGFSMMVGCRWPRRVWAWCVILAGGAPAVALLVHGVGGGMTACSWYQDAGVRFLAALFAIVPGLGSGVFYRCVFRRVRYWNWAQSSLMA